MKTNWKKIIGLLLIFVMVFTATGCSKEDTTTSNEQDTAAVDVSDQEYVYLACVTQVPWWIDHKMALEDFGEDKGVKTTFMGPVDFNVAEEAKMLDDLIAKKPAGIIVFPGDDSLTEVVNRAIEAGIPVVCETSDLPNSDRYAFFGLDGYQAGRVGADVLAEAIGGKGEVILGGFPAPNVQDRIRGYQDVFEEKYPDIKVVDVVNDQADPSKAPEVYAQALAAHPNVVGIAGCDGDSGKGAALAVVDAGLEGKVKIVAMDRNDDMLEYIKSGVITASIAQKSYVTTYMALEALYNIKNDKYKALNDWRAAGVNLLPEQSLTSAWVIDKDNVEQFIHKDK